MKFTSHLLKNKGLQTGLVAFVYWASGQFGALFVVLPGYPTTIWPPAGLGLAAILIYGYRIWPGLLIGALLLHLNIQQWSSLLLVCGAVLQPLLTVGLLNCYTDSATRFIRSSQISLFLIFSTLVGCLVSVLFGLAATFAEQTSISAVWQSLPYWGVWWIANMMSVVTLTPACLVLVDDHFNTPKKAQIIVSLLSALALAMISTLCVIQANKFFPAQEFIVLKTYIFWLLLGFNHIFLGFISVIVLIFTSRMVKSEEKILEKAHDAFVYKELLSQINELAEIGGWERDMVNDTLLWTEQCYRIHEIPFDYDIKPDSGFEFCVPEYRDAVISAAREALETGKFWSFEYEIITAKGNRRRLHASGKGYFESNKIIKMFGFLQDITQRKAAEDERERLMNQLQRVQKMEALGQLAGGMSHEFNNMLQTILGYGHLALQEYGERRGDDLTIYLQQICMASENAKNLVAQILSYSRAQFNAPEWIEPVAVIEEVLLMLKSVMPSTIQLITSFSPELPKILADKNQLHQIIVNLCLNAKDTMNDRGQLNIAIKVVYVSNHCASCHQLFEGHFVQFTIQDDGCGMDYDQQQRIFEPFFTTKEIGKGRGMGLSVAHGLVHENHGHIEVVSEENRGAVFKISFPVRQNEAC